MQEQFTLIHSACVSLMRLHFNLSQLHFHSQQRSRTGWRETERTGQRAVRNRLISSRCRQERRVGARDFNSAPNASCRSNSSALSLLVVSSNSELGPDSITDVCGYGSHQITLRFNMRRQGHYAKTGPGRRIQTIRRKSPRQQNEGIPLQMFGHFEAQQQNQ